MNCHLQHKREKKKLVYAACSVLCCVCRINGITDVTIFVTLHMGKKSCFFLRPKFQNHSVFGIILIDNWPGHKTFIKIFFQASLCGKQHILFNVLVYHYNKI